ncbi:MAG: hypothetical protein HUJ58_01290 [Erysipelotrichaceae bacterium]|nr:hypothetical protein [Erysipelotrichaceae bacterium]
MKKLTITLALLLCLFACSSKQEQTAEKTGFTGAYYYEFTSPATVTDYVYDESGNASQTEIAIDQPGSTKMVYEFENGCLLKMTTTFTVTKEEVEKKYKMSMEEYVQMENDALGEIVYEHDGIRNMPPVVEEDMVLLDVVFDFSDITPWLTDEIWKEYVSEDKTCIKYETMMPLLEGFTEVK